MALGDMTLLLTVAVATALVGRAVAGYGLGGTLAAVGVAFGAEISTALVAAIAGAPALLPGLEVGFALGWASLGAMAFVVLPAWLLRRAEARQSRPGERARTAPAAQRLTGRAS